MDDHFFRLVVEVPKYLRVSKILQNIEHSIKVHFLRQDYLGYLDSV